MLFPDYLQIPEECLGDAEPMDGMIRTLHGCQVEFVLSEGQNMEPGEKRTNIGFGSEIVRDAAFAIVRE
jgi:hypothetical protein